MHACDLLSRTDASFHLGGFGSDDWNLNLKTDFSIFMEQFPDLMRSLDAAGEFQLDLYSQNVERVLIFRPDGTALRIRCVSGTPSFVPDPAEEILPFPAGRQMLARLGLDFVAAIRIVDPRLAASGPFPQWLQGDFGCYWPDR
jgi:hypothetical protein